METTKNENHLTGREGEEFPLKLAADWTRYYREKQPGETISHFFGKEIIQKILSQEGCQGIRIYYALSDIGEKHVIISGATSDGNDQLPSHKADGLTAAISDNAATGQGYILGQQAMPCPGAPGCPTNALTGSKQAS